MRMGMAGLVLAAVTAGLWWLADQAAFVTTTDARVRARIVALSFEIAGQIADIPLQAGDHIVQGQVLARLDDRKARLALAAAALDLKAMEIGIARERLDAAMTRERGDARVNAQASGLDAAAADMAAAQAVLTRAEADQARAATLFAAGLVTRAAMDRSNATLEVARQAAARAKAQLASQHASLGEAVAETRAADLTGQNADALAASAHALRQRIALLKLELEQHAVASPLTGVIDEVFAETGEHVAAGARLALAHGRDDMWIEAHIKEPDLPRIAPGADVEVHLDAGRSACHGVVERVGEAAMSEFALIPNANPAGVFTKITQRVPVRIRINADCGDVRPGAMATLRIRAS